MTTKVASIPELKEKLVIPDISSNYPELGRTYKMPRYEIKYSNRLVRTGKNYYDSLKILAEMTERGDLPKDIRFLLQSEGLAIERHYQRQNKGPRTAEEFKDYFGENKENWEAREWTLTGLRVPKGWENGRKDTGTGKYPRIVLIGDKEDGELQVAEGGGRVIVKFDEVYGIPTETRDIPWPHEGYYTHFYFNTNPSLDKISGDYDVAVARSRDWRHVGHGRCLDVDADFGRWAADSDYGFRPVEGSLPEIGKMLTKINLNQIENEFLERMRGDIKSMPLHDFLEKYKLF